MADGSIPSEFEGRIAEGKNWRDIVAWVSDLPPMPQVANKALRLVENPSCTAPELSKVLSMDAALAARVLKIANSAMFARQREITTLNQAIMLIGLKALKGVIVAATLRQMSKNQGDAERRVWENSMFSAMLASKIARLMKTPWHEEVFLLALLRTIGQIVLLSQDATSNEYKKVFERIKSHNDEYVAAEQSVYGFGHPLIGALVSKKWNFPTETCQVILHYKDPFDSSGPEGDVDRQIAVVQLADSLTHKAGIGSPEGYPNQDANIISAIKFLKIDPEILKLDQLLEEAKTQFEAEKGIYA